MIIWASLLVETALLAGVIFAVLGLIHWRDRKKRLPFTQRILRPAGESLRLRLIELDEKINDRLDQLMLSAYSPLLMAGLVAIQGIRVTRGSGFFAEAGSWMLTGKTKLGDAAIRTRTRVRTARTTITK